jgi:hypothetical protein
MFVMEAASKVDTSGISNSAFPAKFRLQINLCGILTHRELWYITSFCGPLELNLSVRGDRLTRRYCQLVPDSAASPVR